MASAGLQRQSVRLLAIAWGLVVIGALVLVAGYPSIPERVVLYRAPWAEAPMTGSKSLLTVGRIALMGVGQLGAVTAMVLGARGSERWERFWRWLGLAAGVKTGLECAQLVTPSESGLNQAFTGATLAVVAAFLVMAARWWRRGDLEAHPAPAGAPRAWLIASLGLWAVFAIAPRFFV
ncbi:MAG: hypothetical protein EOO73_15660 [Myxococcales bacterium]|nr:MAG: hypothetical protein EOO73_15660 [Myxococcales bacterium]